MKVSTIFLASFTLVLLLLSCQNNELSPNIFSDSDTPRNLNQKNIERLLLSNNLDDTIRIVFTGDSQGFYNEAKDLVNKVNTLEDIDFLIHAGDISDFGLLQEFEWIDNIFSNLKVPYVSVIGNHDMIAQGSKVYNYMYGKENFSFVYDSVKFVFHNTNSRESNFNGKIPDLNFLKSELVPSPTVKGFVAVSHVQPFDVDFDKNLEMEYAGIFANCKDFIISLHGHRHNTSDASPYEDGVRYLNSNSVSKREFLILKIANNKVVKSFVTY